MGRIDEGHRLGAGVAWYRFRRTLRRRAGGYLAIVVLLGLMGGFAMGSLAAARRTASLFSVYWASTSPKDFFGVSVVLNPTIGSNFVYNPSVIRKIGHIRNVTVVKSQAGIDFLPLQKNGAPLNAPNFYPPAAGGRQWLRRRQWSVLRLLQGLDPARAANKSTPRQ